MKKLTREEFVDRMQALADAKGIFIDSGITKNITIAFQFYQDLLAEKERPLQLDSKKDQVSDVMAETPSSITISMDVELERPQCPDCGEFLHLRQATEDEEKEGFRSAWICKKCRYEGLSDKSPMRWIRELPEKGAEEVIVEGRIEKEDLSGG